MAGSKSTKWWIIGGIIALVLAIFGYMAYIKDRLTKAKNWFFATKKTEYEKAIDSMTNGTSFSSVPYGPEIIHWFREYIKANENNYVGNEIVWATFQKVGNDLAGKSSANEAYNYTDPVGNAMNVGQDHAAYYTAFKAYTDEQVAHILQSSWLGGGKIGALYKPFFWTDFSAYYEYIFKDEAQAKSIALTAYDSAGM